jgi:hypothetical protein
LRETRSLSLPVLTCRAEYFLFFFILFFSGKKSETTEREEEEEPEGCGMRNEIHHSPFTIRPPFLRQGSFPDRRLEVEI